MQTIHREPLGLLRLCDGAQGRFANWNRRGRERKSMAYSKAYQTIRGLVDNAKPGKDARLALSTGQRRLGYILGRGPSSRSLILSPTFNCTLSREAVCRRRARYGCDPHTVESLGKAPSHTDSAVRAFQNVKRASQG